MVGAGVAEMTEEEAIKLLDALTGADQECAHIEADNILLAVLETAGYKDVADAYERAQERVRFWYL